MEVARRSWPIPAPRTPGGPGATRTGARSLSAARQGPGRQGGRETRAPTRAPGPKLRTRGPNPGNAGSPLGTASYSKSLKRIHSSKGRMGAGGALRARGKQACSFPRPTPLGARQDVTGFVEAAPGGDSDRARCRGFLRTCDKLRLRARLGSSFSGSLQSMAGQDSKGATFARGWQRAQPRRRRLAVPRALGLH